MGHQVLQERERERREEGLEGLQWEHGEESREEVLERQVPTYQDGNYRVEVLSDPINGERHFRNWDPVDGSSEPELGDGDDFVDDRDSDEDSDEPHVYWGALEVPRGITRSLSGKGQAEEEAMERQGKEELLSRWLEGGCH